MFLPWGYDLTMWGVSFGFLVAFIFGPEFYTTPIFGLTPTFLLEITLYSSGVLTSHTMIAWNIYKFDKLNSFQAGVDFSLAGPIEIKLDK